MPELSIDSASDHPAVALSRDGAITREDAWETRQNHSVELLPAIERLLADAGCDKRDITAVFVDIGPGGYAALRVGVSIAKALAHALAVPLVGVGRLELDALQVVPLAAGRRIVPAHRAGRGELAWGAYRASGGELREMLPPRISPAAAWLDALRPDDTVTGDIDAALLDEARARGAEPLAAAHHRVQALAHAGARRLREGRTDDPRALVPLYLRGPAIGPQPAPGA
ncbi:MAG TPA: tRNA (adenosine(37)-N6)-threonylcarbamoyltransferase complex dimerization subunit type 1 TsaB [Dehalococcoidia bacterium]|nr:tRNA (adenosine(37)-N6)-threonylcarbamoyltransferase complex dimerization subunit type 1 TsaB [Dehalococcoidia bacterium]